MKNKRWTSKHEKRLNDFIKACNNICDAACTPRQIDRLTKEQYNRWINIIKKQILDAH